MMQTAEEARIAVLAEVGRLYMANYITADQFQIIDAILDPVGHKRELESRER